eukprot:3710389-Prymnesium_polylepis.1
MPVGGAPLGGWARAGTVEGTLGVSRSDGSGLVLTRQRKIIRILYTVYCTAGRSQSVSTVVESERALAGRVPRCLAYK